MMNQQYNPLAPEIGPTADQMLQAYRDRAAALRGEQAQQNPQSYNPYQPEQSQEDTQGQHTANMEQWLSPVKQDVYDAQTSYTDDKHDNFINNLSKCPAVKEYGPGLDAYMQSLARDPRLDDQQREEMSQDYFMNVCKPIIDKHLKKDSKANKLHRKQEPEIPEIVKKVRGNK